MAQGTTEPRVVESYTGMIGGGIATVSAGGLGLVIITVVGAVTDSVVTSGWAALAAVGCIVGSMLVLAGIILRHVEILVAKLDEHKADHQAAAIDVEDIATIKRQVGEAFTILARQDLERAEERNLVTQVEEFMAWRAAAVRRLTEAAEQAAADPSVSSQRDAAWLADMAEALEIGREIERRRPPEE